MCSYAIAIAADDLAVVVDALGCGRKGAGDVDGSEGSAAVQKPMDANSANNVAGRVDAEGVRGLAAVSGGAINCGESVRLGSGRRERKALGRQCGDNNGDQRFHGGTLMLSRSANRRYSLREVP